MTIRKFVLAIGLGILILFPGCSCDADPLQAEHSATRNGEAILIFLDISNSVTDAAFETAVKRLEKLYLELPNRRSNIWIYPLFGKTGQMTPPILKIEMKRNLYSQNEQMMQAWESQKSENWQKHKSKLFAKRDVFREEFSGRGGPLNSTCILKSLSDVKRFFRRFPFSRKRLIYISDMLEDCKRTNIDLDESSEAFQAAGEKADSCVTSDNFLADVRISILVPAIPNFPNWIDNDNLLAFWTGVFQKVGMFEGAEVEFEIIADN